MPRWIAPLLVTAAVLAAPGPAARAADIYQPDNLVAWCIVPFDAAKRAPEQRAAMLERIGLHKLAYDWRAEHIPTFDAEVEAMKRHGVEIVAWWFPTSLNKDAQVILEVIQRHQIHPQLWVNCTDPLPKSEDQQAKLKAAVERLRPIVDEAAKAGCKVALYNHGGWGGEPENQLAILDALKSPSVGMVYNFHHGQEHIGRFAEFWPKIKGHVLAVTLNGMSKGTRGEKIMTVGEGDSELTMMRVIRDSGWQGIVNILNHRADVDAEQGLTRNMAGVERLRRELDHPGSTPEAAKPRAAQPVSGKAFMVAGRPEYQAPPITVEMRATVRSSSRYNILIASEDKRSPTHWELFANKGTGVLSAYLPGYAPDLLRSNTVIADGVAHDLAMVFEPARVRLYVDGRQVTDTKVKATGVGQTRFSLELAIGSLVDGSMPADGAIEQVRISKGARPINAAAGAKLERDEQTIDLWTFEPAGGARRNDGRSPGLVMHSGGAARVVRTAGATSDEAAGETEWAGYINISERDRYRFNAGGAAVTINGVAVKGDEPVLLNRGANAFVMRSGGGGAVRLLWSSTDFPWEPVPATAFSHDAPDGETARKLVINGGRTLMAEMRCVRCHTPAAEAIASGGMPELTALDAPMLLDAGLRLNPAWVERWVENPHAMRPGATMPALVQPGEGKHVAAFLETLGFGEAPKKPAADDVAVKRGGELYAQLGCVGCHTIERQPRVAAGRMSLRHVAWKYKPGALADYLAGPAKRYVWTRMPDFKFTSDEAASLAAFLEANGDKAETFTGGIDEMGAKIVARAGCVACHPMTVGNELKAPMLGAIKDWQRGCLGVDEAARGGAPKFAFTAPQRTALSEFGRAGLAPLGHDTAADFARRQVARLNCAACHQRDGVTDTWTLASAEVGRLLPHTELKPVAAEPKAKKAKKKEDAAQPEVDQSRPTLTYAGEKLRVDFMSNIIGGTLDYKPRPWMTARMPSFGAYGPRLADGLAAEHGLTAMMDLEKPAEPAMVEAGRQLVTKQKGFGCADCHALGDQPATAVFEAEGVNLAYASQRLRPEYYRRWLHDPTRIDPATKMPRYAEPDGTTPLTEIGAGDAAWQFEAIRRYIATLTPPRTAIIGERGGAPVDYTKMTDANWTDDRPGQVMASSWVTASTVKLPRERAVYKALTMRVGDKGEATVCFDTATLKWRAAWTGGFLDLGSGRFGLTGIPTPHGDIAWITPGAGSGWAKDGSFDDPRKSEYESLPREWGKFLGYYLSGKRVVLRYSVGGVEVLDSPWVEQRDGKPVITREIEVAPSAKEMRMSGVNGKVVTVPPHDRPVRLVVDDRGESSPDPASPRQWTAGAAPRLGEPLVARGVIGKGTGPFQIDTLTIPYDNPDGALFFTAGHDFIDDGRAAVCTAHGDVWLVSGIDEKLEKLTWKRFASGLYQPLGLKIVDGKVFVICRDGLVRLHDLNGDGEADYYERFNNDLQVTSAGHSFANCLETDAEGNFYFVKCSDPGDHAGCVLKVSADGEKLEVLATGLRNPNGMGMGPGNVLTEADNQGNWVPETRVDIIKPGGFYGFVPHAHRTPAPTSYDGPLCWVPRVLDNSAGGQVWVPSSGWGALGGQMLHLSYGRCGMMMILRDTVDGVEQGATVPLPGRFLSGVMRGRFNPRDGNLYLTGLNGWQTGAVRDGCFQRVRYTGKPIDVPTGWAVKKDAIELTFARKMDPKLAADVENYSAQQWNYLWSERYGSKDWSVEDPTREGRDPVAITAARLLDDGRTVRLEVPGLKPVMQMRLTYNLDAADGTTVKGVIYPTINRVPSR